MKTDISIAREALSGDVTCAVAKDGELYISHERGIKPLLSLIRDRGDFLSGASVADKIIGRAAAYLAVYGGAVEVYGEVMTGEGREILTKNGIKASLKTEVVHIINRRGDGICPMEMATAGVTDAEVAYKVLAKKVFGE